MPQSAAQSLNWGAAVGTPLIDSDGDAIDDRFVFELGAFALDFDPNEGNVGEWLTHWRVFDALTFDPTFGLTTSTIYIPTDVTSDSVFATDSTFDFSGLDAYIWVRHGDDPVPGSEWYVGRAGNWTFPLVGGDCCGIDFIEWSTTDLSIEDVPNWGRQSQVPGPGESNFPVGSGFDGLQTHTFIPEPSSALLTFIAGFGLMLRRRRNA